MRWPPPGSPHIGDQSGRSPSLLPPSEADPTAYPKWVRVECGLGNGVRCLVMKERFMMRGENKYSHNVEDVIAIGP